MTVAGIGPGRLLTSRGWAVVVGCTAILALGLWWGYSMLVGLAVGLLLALGADVVLVLLPLRLRVSRRIEPAAVQRHGDCVALVQIEGRLPALSQVTLTDRVRESYLAIELHTHRATYRVPTARRGLLQVGPVRVCRAGLFGLATTTRECGAPAYVCVLPRSIPLHEVMTGRRRCLVGADEWLEHGGTDLLGLHEYAPGDDLRRLHWATSARAGMPMIREDAESAMRRLAVVVDDHAAHYGDHDREAEEFEDAVEFAYALCRRAMEFGLPVHVATTSGSVDVSVPGHNDATGGERLPAALADMRCRRTGSGDAPALHLHRSSMDTVVVLSGARAPVRDLAVHTAYAAKGVIGQIDRRGGSATATMARDDRPVIALRAPDSIELARLWDRVIR